MTVQGGGRSNRFKQRAEEIGKAVLQIIKLPGQKSSSKTANRNKISSCIHSLREVITSRTSSEVSPLNASVISLAKKGGVEYVLVDVLGGKALPRLADTFRSRCEPDSLLNQISMELSELDPHTQSEQIDLIKDFVKILTSPDSLYRLSESEIDRNQDLINQIKIRFDYGSMPTEAPKTDHLPPQGPAKEVSLESSKAEDDHYVSIPQHSKNTGDAERFTSKEELEKGYGTISGLEGNVQQPKRGTSLEEMAKKTDDAVDKILSELLQMNKKMESNNLGGNESGSSADSMMARQLENEVLQSTASTKTVVSKSAAELDNVEKATGFSITDKIRAKVNESLTNIRDVESSIQKSHVEHQKEMVNLYLDTYNACKSMTSTADIEEKIGEFKEASFVIREKINEKLETHYKEIEKHLFDLANQKNEIATKFSDTSSHEELEALKKMDRECADKIRSLQLEQKALTLSTNTRNITDSKIILFQGVMERQFSLLKEKIELINLETKTIEEQTQYDSVISQLGEISDEEINSLKDNIHVSLNKPSENLSPKEAKNQYIENKTEEWGKKFLSIALTNSANWVSKYEVGIRFSRQGIAQVATTKVEPQNIDKKGGVPAGLRGKKGYASRPANFNKTTTYILTGRETHGREYVSFRIAQFLTMESAKEALIGMMRENPTMITDYHDNTLLTPTMFPNKLDRKLVHQHQENIKLAFESIKEDIQNGEKIEDYTVKDIETIMAKFTMSNFGVNEGAVGELKIGGVKTGAKLGWHTSMGKYNNSASNKLNKTLEEKLSNIEKKIKRGDQLTDEENAIFDRLGGLVEVGQEFEAIWAKNDYMKASVGNNQVKSPALWRTLDSLLGITVNTHCMSAKDRASIVEANSIEYLIEIEMNLADHKHNLELIINGNNSEINDEQKNELLQGAFTRDEIQGLLKDLNNFDVNLKDLKLKKLTIAQKSLGLTKGGKGFIQEKKGVSKFRSLKAQGWRISKNKPLRDTHPTNAFSQLSLPSIYEKTGKIDPLSPSHKEVEVLEQRHRMHQNRLEGLMISDLVTKENTGVPGSKLKGGKSLKRFYSGFDSDYVLYRLSKAQNNAEFKTLFHVLLGTSQMDKASRDELVDKAMAAFKDNGKMKIKEWKAVIKEAENFHYLSHRPLKKVSS